MMGREQSRLKVNQLGMEMFLICEDQLRNTREAFFSLNKGLAEKVISAEKRVNGLDLELDRECERFLALYQPVAKDLRFVLGLRKINSGLERIGDYCFGISKFIIEMDGLPDENVLGDLRVREMFMSTHRMFEDVALDFCGLETKRAREIFKRKQTLNEILTDAFFFVCREVKKDPSRVDQYLLIFTVIKKLERVGDLISTISGEIIFYREAEIWKHQEEKFEWD